MWLCSRKLAIALVSTSPLVTALGPNDAETVFQDFNNVFFGNSSEGVYYRSSVDTASEPQLSWAGALNILAAEDAYDRTGDPDKK